jgi:hypothetical protein
MSSYTFKNLSAFAFNLLPKINNGSIPRWYLEDDVPEHHRFKLLYNKLRPTKVGT